MGVRRTWYLNETVDEMLHEIKLMNNFSSMNDVFHFLINNQKNQGVTADKKIAAIDKNVQMLIEMVSFQCDKTDTIPSVTVEKGYSFAYNKAQEIVKENIERATKQKRENQIIEGGN